MFVYEKKIKTQAIITVFDSFELELCISQSFVAFSKAYLMMCLYHIGLTRNIERDYSVVVHTGAVWRTSFYSSTLFLS